MVIKINGQPLHLGNYGDSVPFVEFCSIVGANPHLSTVSYETPLGQSGTVERDAPVPLLEGTDYTVGVFA